MMLNQTKCCSDLGFGDDWSYWFMIVDFGKPLPLKLNHNCFKDLVGLFKSIVGNDVKSSFQDKVSLQAKANAS